jgi:hypothetical protein
MTNTASRREVAAPIADGQLDVPIDGIELIFTSLVS